MRRQVIGIHGIDLVDRVGGIRLPRRMIATNYVIPTPVNDNKNVSKLLCFQKTINTAKLSFG